VPQERAEPGLGQDGRVDAMRDLPQFVHGGTQTISQPRQLALDLVHRLGCHRRYGVGLQGKRDQTLLNTVMQVTLEAPPCLVRGGDDPAREADSSVRVWVLAMAVPSSSVNSARRPSARSGMGQSVDAIVTSPRRLRPR